MVIQPAQTGGKKPASVLFGKVTRRGKPVSVEEMDAALAEALAAELLLRRYALG
jgi:hypothetical protein